MLNKLKNPVCPLFYSRVLAASYSPMSVLFRHNRRVRLLRKRGFMATQ